MKGLDSMVRLMLRAQGTGLRWLREELQAANVRIRLTDGCLEELVRNAEAAATRSSGRSYVERFRQELAVRANFIQRLAGAGGGGARRGGGTRRGRGGGARK